MACKPLHVATRGIIALYFCHMLAAAGHHVLALRGQQGAHEAEAHLGVPARDRRGCLQQLRCNLARPCALHPFPLLLPPGRQPSPCSCAAVGLGCNPSPPPDARSWGPTSTPLGLWRRRCTMQTCWSSACRTSSCAGQCRACPHARLCGSQPRGSFGHACLDTLAWRLTVSVGMHA
jgi:hypothetical protein